MGFGTALGGLRGCSDASCPSRPLHASQVSKAPSMRAAPRLPGRVVQVKASATPADATPVLAAAAEDKKFLGVSVFTWQKIVPLGLMFFWWVSPAQRAAPLGEHATCAGRSPPCRCAGHFHQPLRLHPCSILFNYTILRDTKDVLVVTAPGSGAEIIPFLKTWVNLPMAIGFTVLYTKVGRPAAAAAPPRLSPAHSSRRSGRTNTQ